MIYTDYKQINADVFICKVQSRMNLGSSAFAHRYLRNVLVFQTSKLKS